jgi:hypothetical protein
MPETKTFIYRYDDDRENEEEVTDSLGEVEVPRMGEKPSPD